MISRHRFLATSAVLAGGTLVTPVAVQSPTRPQASIRLRPGGDDSGRGPWLEVDAKAFRHNDSKVSRLAGGRPILAVVKNNAYGVSRKASGVFHLAKFDVVVCCSCGLTRLFAPREAVDKLAKSALWEKP